MTAIEIARQFAALGRTEDAIKAYAIAVHQSGATDPAVQMEGALYLLQNGGNYKVSYSWLLDLHRRGCYREDCLSIMTQAFYEPNVKLLKSRYRNNCKLLAKYPYLFRRDFPDFEFLPLRFYPYDDNRFVPYDGGEGRFGEYIDFKRPVISRNFFKDLEKPVLARDVYSQYELEYLNDTVRPSEWVGRENHIYLHYTDWGTFCAHLQCLNLKPLLADKKIVFLIGDEVEQYPIDFKERFGIDYSRYPVKPLGLGEIHRLIWHTQLSTHNGGDFFNEIFDAHPNLMARPSRMMENVEETIQTMKEGIARAKGSEAARRSLLQANTPLVQRVLLDLLVMPAPTDKDFLVAEYMGDEQVMEHVDPAARIAPAVFFQPHFPNMEYGLRVDAQGRTLLESDQYDQVVQSPMFRGFRYVKTFTPMRRPTTSHGASMRFAYNRVREDNQARKDEDARAVIFDKVSQQVLNRSFMIDWQDRLFADSILVRFEDAKLNPRATFTALAAFLDLPYTESMTYCSLRGERDPESLAGNDIGFSTAAVYRTYDEYVNDSERKYIEYCLRDAYECYGYDFHYYDGRPMTEERLNALAEEFTTIDRYIRETYEKAYVTMKIARNGEDVGPEAREEAGAHLAEKKLQEFRDYRKEINRVLAQGLSFYNRKGQPLHMMPMLELDPALLEQPLYH